MRKSLLVLALLPSGCAASRRDSGPYKYAPRDDEPKEASKKKSEEESESGRSAAHVILLYIPNRFLDLFDMVRFGIDVGPGIGAIITPTEYLQVSFLTRISAGVGFQTFRHLPFKAGADSEVGFGILTIEANPGINWYRNVWDLRVELHVLLVGGHVAVNPAEIADFILGFTTIDIMGDDY